MTMSLPRLLFFSLTGNDLGFRRAIDAVEGGLDRGRSARGGRGGHADGRSSTSCSPRARTTTSCATSSSRCSPPATRRRRARSRGRSSASPATRTCSSALRDDEPGYADAVVKEVLRTRPVLTIAARKLVAPLAVGGWELPAGAHVAPCIYLTHRRPELYPDPTAFRPERFLGDGAPDGYAWLPFGGGMRRCVGAAFAAMEMTEVLRAVAARVTLRPDRPAGERMRRRSVTLTPGATGERGRRAATFS